VTTQTVPASTLTMPILQLKSPRPWSPRDPFLYDLLFEVLNRKGEVIDQVKSYAGLRKVRGISSDRSVLVSERSGG